MNGPQAQVDHLDADRLQSPKLIFKFPEQKAALDELWAARSRMTPYGTSLLLRVHGQESRPHALHSLDPQGGVDLAEVKRRSPRTTVSIASDAARSCGSGSSCRTSSRRARSRGGSGLSL